MMFAEMSCYYESIGTSVYAVLQNIFKKFGYFVEKTISITFPGIDGMQKMADIMLKLRKSKYDVICGKNVLKVDDMVDGVRVSADGKKTKSEITPIRFT